MPRSLPKSRPQPGNTAPKPDRPARLAPATPGRECGIDPLSYFLVLERVGRLLEYDTACRLADAEAVLDKALQRVEAGRSSVVSHDRYEAWVSVVCRNVYLNFLRSRRGIRTVRESDSTYDPQDRLRAGYDLEIVREALDAAIDRLPAFLRPVARLRFAEDESHAAIAQMTGRDLPIVRAYANKAAKRLSSDARLVRVLSELRGDGPTRMC